MQLFLVIAFCFTDRNLLDLSLRKPLQVSLLLKALRLQRTSMNL